MMMPQWWRTGNFLVSQEQYFFWSLAFMLNWYFPLCPSLTLVSVPHCCMLHSRNQLGDLIILSRNFLHHKWWWGLVFVSSCYFGSWGWFFRMGEWDESSHIKQLLSQRSGLRWAGDENQTVQCQVLNYSNAAVVSKYSQCFLNSLQRSLPVCLVLATVKPAYLRGWSDCN